MSLRDKGKISLFAGKQRIRLPNFTIWGLVVWGGESVEEGRLGKGGPEIAFYN